MPSRSARQIAPPVFLLVLALSQVALASAPIHGDYCGKAVSGGEWVDVVTSLKTSTDGLLTGSYKFEDNGEIVPGTLREETKRSGETRTLVWVDKYGTGKLTMRFAPHHSSFEGEWGLADQIPIFGWNGEHCNFDSVSIPILPSTPDMKPLVAEAQSIRSVTKRSSPVFDDSISKAFLRP